MLGADRSNPNVRGMSGEAYASRLLRMGASVQHQTLILGMVLFFAGVMATGTIQLVRADTSDMNIAANVVAGSLSIVTPSQLNFSSGEPGSIITANTGSAAANAVILSDTTGSLSGWQVTGFFNTNFYKTTDSNIQMAIASRTSWYPGDMTVSGNTGNADGVNKGSNDTFPGIGSGNPLTLATSNNSHAEKGAGIFDLYNLKFNYNIPVAAQAANYQVNMRMTIV